MRSPHLIVGIESHSDSFDIDFKWPIYNRVCIQAYKLLRTERACLRWNTLAVWHLLLLPTSISPHCLFSPFPFPRGPLKSHFSGRETSNCQIGGREGTEKGQRRLERKPSFYTAFSNVSRPSPVVNSHRSQEFIRHVFQCQEGPQTLLQIQGLKWYFQTHHRFVLNSCTIGVSHIYISKFYRPTCFCTKNCIRDLLAAHEFRNCYFAGV
jgi:hypothetical protein